MGVKAFGLNEFSEGMRTKGDRELLAVVFDCFGVLVTELGDTWVRE